MYQLPALPAMGNDTEVLEEESAPNWFNNFVNKFFKSQKSDVATQAQNKPLNLSIQMKKDYQKVNSILNIEGVEVDKDGKVTLTEEQVKALNDRITNLEQESSDKDDEIAELKKQNENLKNGDGDETAKINGDEGQGNDVDKLNTAVEMFNSVKDLL